MRGLTERYLNAVFWFAGIACGVEECWLGDGGDSRLCAMDEGIVEGECVSEEPRGTPCSELCLGASSPRPRLLVLASFSRAEDLHSDGRPGTSVDSGVGFSITVPKAAKELCERRV